MQMEDKREANPEISDRPDGQDGFLSKALVPTIINIECIRKLLSNQSVLNGVALEKSRRIDQIVLRISERQSLLPKA
jgi:hypothetical protein